MTRLQGFDFGGRMGREIRLTCFELGKIWGRKHFLRALLLLVSLNLFLLWYTNLPEGDTYDLSSLKAFRQEIRGLSEEEKAALMNRKKELMDGVSLVQEVLFLQKETGEPGTLLADQAMAANPGVFEAYYDLYQNGEYLGWTDSFWKEQVLTEELYGQWQKAAEYEGYLLSIQERRDTLSGIGIFGGEGDAYSAQNIEKSADDYAGLLENQVYRRISWMPDQAVTGAMENLWTDLFLLLSVFLFVGCLMMEEKGKGLFPITRSTKYGIFHSIAAKLGALLVHCLAAAALLYGANLAFFGIAVGFGGWNAPLQPLAAYRESSLPLSIWHYVLLSVLTKVAALFGFGGILTAICIRAEELYVPYLAGAALLGISFLLYALIPAASRGSGLKYLNLAGVLRTELLYGDI